MAPGPPPPSTQRYYDEFSEWYERERSRGYHALVDRLESELACRYGRDGRVLEAGCGTGLILRRVAEVAREAHGVDLSRGMLARAHARALSCAQATVTQLPFPNDHFDLVYSFKVLAHVAPIGDAVAELARVTRPGGHLLLEFYNAHSLRYWVRRVRPGLRISARIRDDAVFTRYDRLRDIRRLLPEQLELEGLRGVRVLLPLPHLLRLPLVGRVLETLETWAADAKGLRGLGGFLVVILRKR
jgi:SAM-dependent methyltransferase